MKTANVVNVYPEHVEINVFVDGAMNGSLMLRCKEYRILVDDGWEMRVSDEDRQALENWLKYDGDPWKACQDRRIRDDH